MTWAELSPCNNWTEHVFEFIWWHIQQRLLFLRMGVNTVSTCVTALSHLSDRLDWVCPCQQRPSWHLNVSMCLSVCLSVCLSAVSVWPVTLWSTTTSSPTSSSSSSSWAAAHWLQKIQSEPTPSGTMWVFLGIWLVPGAKNSDIMKTWIAKVETEWPQHKLALPLS